MKLNSALELLSTIHFVLWKVKKRYSNVVSNGLDHHLDKCPEILKMDAVGFGQSKSWFV